MKPCLLSLTIIAMLAAGRVDAQDVISSGAAIESEAKTRSVVASTFRVLSIGITKYDELASLEFTTTDARQVIQAYADVGNVDDNRLTLIVDDDREQLALTGQVVEESITTFLQSCSSKETAVVFFSGHGVRLDSGFWLAASDFGLADGSSGLISMERLRLSLSRCSAQSKVVILDCCHSGGFGAAPSDIASSFRSVPGCVVIAASRPSEASLETRSLKSGVFTHWLIRGLRGEANTKIDGGIDATELFDYVSKGVRATTSSVQTPAIAFDQSTIIPLIIDLRKPDRPSDNVGVIPFPLPPTPDTMLIVLDTVGRFPDANPRKTIGFCHWVLQHADTGSEPAEKARKLIAIIDDKILAGKLTLGGKESDEQ